MPSIQEQSSERAFWGIFEGAPVALWDEDFSLVKKLLDGFVQSGITNIRQYLSEHPEAVRECVERVRVRHVNRVAREFYGAESEQHLIESLPSLFDESALEIFREEVSAFAEGSSSFEAELSVTTLTGERRRVVMNVSLLEAPESDWSKVVVAFTDITERRRLEKSLERANEALRRVNVHLEQFAYAAAHDMREPLRTIALYAQLLQRYQPPEPGTKAETALEHILGHSRRMETLVDDLLTFARAVETHGTTPAAGEADFRTVLDDVVSSLARSLQESGAQISVDSNAPPANMQAVHLRQILQNLVSNAIKYRAPDRKLDIRISAETKGGDIEFCVADNGIGIKSDYHDQIFGIFKRLHGQNIEGNGIGLALCKKIVEDYGGRIWVESAPGTGSSFCFTVPLSRDLP